MCQCFAFIYVHFVLAFMSGTPGDQKRGLTPPSSIDIDEDRFIREMKSERDDFGMVCL